MATPFVAGSAALLLSVKGKSADVTSAARTLFQTTAQMVPSNKTDGDPLQTLTQQGAGLINVFNAVHATTIVSPGELILNDTANFKPMLVIFFFRSILGECFMKLRLLPHKIVKHLQSRTRERQRRLSS
jgi:hypothetical protein